MGRAGIMQVDAKLQHPTASPQRTAGTEPQSGLGCIHNAHRDASGYECKGWRAASTPVKMRVVDRSSPLLLVRPTSSGKKVPRSPRAPLTSCRGGGDSEAAAGQASCASGKGFVGACRASDGWQQLTCSD